MTIDRDLFKISIDLETESGWIITKQFIYYYN